MPRGKLRHDGYPGWRPQSRRQEMNSRFLALFSLVSMAAASLAAQPGLSRDGQPDLQGTWLDNSATPLERPKELEGTQFLTDDEVTELTQRAARLFNSDADF